MSAYLVLGVPAEELDDPKPVLEIDDMTAFCVDGKQYVCRILDVADPGGIIEIDPRIYMDTMSELDKELADHGAPEVKMYLINLSL